jgi:hypothetical protein
MQDFRRSLEHDNSACSQAAGEATVTTPSLHVGCLDNAEEGTITVVKRLSGQALRAREGGFPDRLSRSHIS